jgi:hypothetical protein
MSPTELSKLIGLVEAGKILGWCQNPSDLDSPTEDHLRSDRTRVQDQRADPPGHYFPRNRTGERAVGFMGNQPSVSLTLTEPPQPAKPASLRSGGAAALRRRLHVARERPDFAPWEGKIRNLLKRSRRWSLQAP